MEVCFTKLHIAGFKSFADSASIDILPGLTGVIGPNGCGKSNIVEALRWVMGESSARSLRGGEMDDVIFAGTANRSSRNIAEVSLSVENATGLAPAPYRELPELQITRRIERNSGSTYYLNNKVQRARDIQTLFADMAAGARSSAMVSQGKVATLVSAKPEERRTILEEAAGITGIHTRRKEAEQKLQAAENNLERVQDRLDQLASQHTTLSEQSAQAAIYRQLSEALRQAQDLLLLTTLKKNHEQVETTRKALQKARAELQTLEQNQQIFRQQEEGQQEDLNKQKQALDQQRTELETLRLTLESLIHEEKAALKAVENTQKHLQHLQSQLEAAQNRSEEALDRHKNLQDEYETLQSQLAGFKANYEAILLQKADYQKAYAHAEQTCQTTQEALRAAQHAHEIRLKKNQENEAQKARLSTLLDTLQSDLSESEALLPDSNTLDSLENETEELHQHISLLEQKNTALANVAAEAAIALSQAENALTQVEKEHRYFQTQMEEQTAQHTNLSHELTRLQIQQDECNTALKALPAENAALEQLEEAEQAFQRATSELENHQKALAQATLHRQEMTEALQLLKNIHQGVQQHYQQAIRNREALYAQHQKLAAALQEAEAQHLPPEQLTSAKHLLDTARDNSENAQNEHTQLEVTLKDHSCVLQHTQTSLQDIQNRLERLYAQRQGLQAALASDATQTYTPIAEKISIPEGFEDAVAAALADGLEAGENTDNASYWLSFKEIEPPPFAESSLCPLSKYLKAPQVLKRALDAIALAESAEQAHRLAPHLVMGQSLVTRDGGLWRWDGYHIAPGHPSSAARKLAQRQKLSALSADIAQLEKDLPLLRHAQEEAQAKHAEIMQQVNSAHMAVQEAHTQLLSAQQAFTQLEHKHAAALARSQAIAPQYEQVGQQLAEAVQEEEKAQTEHTHLEALSLKEEALQTAQTAENAARTEEARARQHRKEKEENWLLARKQDDALRQQREKKQMQRQNLETYITHNLAKQERIQLTLKKLEEQKQALPSKHTLAENVHEASQVKNTAQNNVQIHTETLEGHKTSFEEKRKKLQALKQTYAEQNSKLSVLRPRFQETQREYEALIATIGQTENEDVFTQHLLKCQAEHTQAQALLNEASMTLKTAEETQRSLETTREIALARTQTLAREKEEWANRLAEAQTEKIQAENAYKKAHDELALIASHPEQKHALYEETRQKLIHIEETYGLAQKTLRTLQESYEQSSRTQQKAADSLASLRENIARLESRHEQAQAALSQLYAEHPALSEQNFQGFSPSESETSLKTLIHSLKAEREALGPVNLRAELESQTVSDQITSLSRENRDLTEAITKLHSSIAELNHEGRERLKAVFEKVNTNFQDLFTRMFNGGKAYLAMVGDSDPLLAGLEIFAQPPGKKLSSLSLLSGGEQALTAISLIFAIFHCTPAPICVLDEVDAPLDDANIQRFCNLLADMVAQTGTRFLVVTHHQLTMAHMDRLYGITMQERGVSRVLSVDFTKAVSMVEKI